MKQFIFVSCIQSRNNVIVTFTEKITKIYSFEGYCPFSKGLVYFFHQSQLVVFLNAFLESRNGIFSILLIDFPSLRKFNTGYINFRNISQKIVKEAYPNECI